MSRAPTGRVTPSCSAIAAAIRSARGTPRRWMPTRTSPSVPAWRLDDLVGDADDRAADLVRRHDLATVHQATGPAQGPVHPPRRGTCVLLPGLAGPVVKGFGAVYRAARRARPGRVGDDDGLVARVGHAAQLPGGVAAPGVHRDEASLPVPAGRRRPGEPVGVQREAGERGRVGEDDGPERPVVVDGDERQASRSGLGGIRDPDAEVASGGIEADLPVGDRLADGLPRKRPCRRVGGAVEERLPVGGDEAPGRGNPGLLRVAPGERSGPEDDGPVRGIDDRPPDAVARERGDRPAGGIDQERAGDDGGRIGVRRRIRARGLGTGSLGDACRAREDPAVDPAGEDRAVVVGEGRARCSPTCQA